MEALFIHVRGPRGLVIQISMCFTPHDFLRKLGFCEFDLVRKRDGTVCHLYATGKFYGPKAHQVKFTNAKFSRILSEPTPKHQLNFFGGKCKLAQPTGILDIEMPIRFLRSGRITFSKIWR